MRLAFFISSLGYKRRMAETIDSWIHSGKFGSEDFLGKVRLFFVKNCRGFWWFWYLTKLSGILYIVLYIFNDLIQHTDRITVNAHKKFKPVWFSSSCNIYQTNGMTHPTSAVSRFVNPTPVVSRWGVLILLLQFAGMLILLLLLAGRECWSCWSCWSC